jgi:hypothetical protein
MTSRRNSKSLPKANTPNTLDEEPKDRPFDPWRRPRTAAAKDLVKWVIGIFEDKEAREAPRVRRRRATDQAVMEATIAALVCDAIHRDLVQPGGRVAITLSNQKLGKRSRYRPPVLSKTLPHILALLASSILKVEKGHQGFFGKARQTTFSISPRFRSVVAHRKIGLADLCREADGELVILKKAKEDFWSGGELVEYVDTPTTRAFRDRLRRINLQLASADIDVDEAHPVAGRIDLSDRTMRRYFNNGRFDHGGRLFGGFWQSLSKADRAGALIIDGDSPVTVDFRQMAARLLYARVGAHPPGDCYAVPDYEQYRSGWKKLLNAMLFQGDALTRLPQGTATLLPPRIGLPEARRRLLEHNRPIAHLFRRDIGFELMFMESQILVDVLLDLGRKGISALPIHDAVIVAEGRAREVAAVMTSVFRTHTGVRGEVSFEGSGVRDGVMV